jgi:hypothetical protein
MLYSDIVPLDRERHRDFRLDVSDERFAVAGRAHVIPALMQEFATASSHLPIVFLPGSQAPVAVFLVGLRTGQSALVDSSGHWRGEYVPAYLRRYPFMFGEVAGGEPIVCIDGQYKPPVEGEGERIFSGTGEDLPILVERVRLMNEYYGASKANETFVKTLNELALLRSISVDAKFPTGESVSMQGLLMVDEEKLNTLPDEVFLRLRKEGLLPAIYAHLLSLATVENLRKLS